MTINVILNWYDLCKMVRSFHIWVHYSFHHLCKPLRMYILTQIFIHSNDMSAIVKVEGKHMNHIILWPYSHEAAVNRAYLWALEGITAPAPPPHAIFSISLSFSSFPPFSLSLPFPPLISPLPSPLPHLHHFLSSPSFLTPLYNTSLTHKVQKDSLKHHYSFCRIL